MIEQVTLTHELVDDIPLLIGVMQQLGLPELLEKHIGSHGLHQGLSNGWLATLWLAYIMSENNHHKSSVQEWAQLHRHSLERLVGQALRPVELSDDRLGIVLRRLSDTTAWEAVEAELWQRSLAVYALEVESVRLDSTTTYGYHRPRDGGLLQFGQSKGDHPDLPQLKLMAACAQPTGQLLACDIYPGQRADDGLYLPLWQRVRQMLGRTGLLYVGDGKMAALATRAEMVRQQDYYLTVLPLTGQAGQEIDGWIAAAVSGQQPLMQVWQEEQLLADAYEFEQPRQALLATGPLSWTERVQLVRSLALAEHETRHLEKRLAHAEREIWGLTPPPKRGVRRYREAAALQQAVTQVLQRHKVAGLLQVQWQAQLKAQPRYAARGRPRTTAVPEPQVARYQITAVTRDEVAQQQAQARLGWRVYITNLPYERSTLEQCVLLYRSGWCLERDFHLIKDRPLGISPLYVRREDQILGLTRLLTLGVRLSTWIELQVRRGLAQAGEVLSGLYQGQPKRTEQRPTAVRLLKAFTRAQITLTRIQVGAQQVWHLTPLPDHLLPILTYLGLPVSLYLHLSENSP